MEAKTQIINVLKNRVQSLEAENFKLRQDIFTMKNPIPDHLELVDEDIMEIDGFEIVASPYEDDQAALKSQKPRRVTPARHRKVPFRYGKEYFHD